MSATPAIPLLARISADHAASEAARPTDGVTHLRRRAAMARVGATGLPTNRDENWRYANLRPLERARFAPRRPTPVDVERARALLPAPVSGHARFVFVDGCFASALSAALGVCKGLTLRIAPATALGAADSPDERLAALNEAFALDGIHVASAAGSHAAAEVLFIALTKSAEAASYPQLIVEVGADSRLSLIERHLGEPHGATFVNAAIQIDVGSRATLEHHRAQSAGGQALHFETVVANVHDEARYELNMVSLGGQSARGTVRIALRGRRAAVRLAMAIAPDGAQVNDTYARIEHLAAETDTDELFRGIAAGRSRAAFNGHIVMRAHATGAVSRQSLRTLLAGPGAEADVRPQLEIYTDDVRASHGATIGKLDDAMLFYLLSRGIDPDTAQSLLKWAFLTEVVARITVPELRRDLEHAIAARFAGKDAAVAKDLL